MKQLIWTIFLYILCLENTVYARNMQDVLTLTEKEIERQKQLRGEKFEAEGMTYTRETDSNKFKIGNVSLKEIDFLVQDIDKYGVFIVGNYKEIFSKELEERELFSDEKIKNFSDKRVLNVCQKPIAIVPTPVEKIDPICNTRITIQCAEATPKDPFIAAEARLSCEDFYRNTCKFTTIENKRKCNNDSFSVFITNDKTSIILDNSQKTHSLFSGKSYKEIIKLLKQTYGSATISIKRGDNETFFWNAKEWILRVNIERPSNKVRVSYINYGRLRM